MSRFKLVLSCYLYVLSCVSLLAAPIYVAMLLAAYGAGFPASHGPLLPAFSGLTVSVMPHATGICISVVAASLLLAAFVLRRVKDRETRLYWVGILANVNFYSAFFLFGLVLIGFFVLLKVANSA